VQFPDVTLSQQQNDINNRWTTTPSAALVWGIKDKTPKHRLLGLTTQEAVPEFPQT